MNSVHICPQVGNTALPNTVIGYLSVVDPDNVIRPSIQKHHCEIIQAEEYFAINATDDEDDAAALALLLYNPLPLDIDEYDITVR